MASLNGSLLDDSCHSVGNALLPPGEQTRTRMLVPPQGGPVPTFAIGEAELQAFFSRGVFFPSKQLLSSWEGEAYSDDFYHRVHFIPKSVDFGVFSSDTGQHVLLWHAFFHDQDLTDIGGVNLDGIDIQGELPAVTFPSVSVAHYDVLADVDSGPPVVDGEYQFIIGGETYTLEVTGYRIIFFPFLPNWKNDVGQRLRFQNTVIRNTNGREQVMTITENPRQTFDYESIVDKRHLQLFDNMVWASQWRNFLVSVPFDAGWASLASGTNAGDLTVALVGDDNLSFHDGGLLVIYQDPETFEIATIDQYVGGGMTLARGLDGSWPAGTDVYPVVAAHIGAQVDVDAITDQLFVPRMSWICDPELTVPMLPDVAEPETYNGYELFTKEPNWASTPKQTYSSDYDTFDQPGAISYLQNQDGSTVYRQMEFLLCGRAEIAEFSAFLKRRDGYRVPCYMPLRQNAFHLLSEVFSATTSLVMEPNGFSRLIGVKEARKHFVVAFWDGQWLPFEVVDVVQNIDGNIELEMASSFGVGFLPADVMGIYPLPLMRMSSEVSLRWKTNGICTVDAAFSTVTP